jgi:predicted ATP-dependent endonuclease of OLD family
LFHITNVRISGFWGKHLVNVNLNQDVNVFIGRNGTGKTTFINIVEAVLKADLRMLMSLDFKEVKISLKDENKTRTIKAEKKDVTDAPFEMIIFSIGRNKFNLPLYATEIEFERYYRRRPRLEEMYTSVQDQIHQLVNISTLSVHRSYRQTDDEPTHRRTREVTSPVDQRLEGLLREFTSFQLRLAEKSNEISREFQRDVLTSVLYDKEMDKFSIKDTESVNLDELHEKLTTAYRELGALDPQTTKKIDQHVAVLRKSVTNFQKANKEKVQRYTLDDILPIPLLKRTKHITQLSLNAETKKQELFSPVTRFLRTLKEFIDDKEVTVGSGGELLVQENKKTIPIPELSSGEKQLLILLIETLLQENKFFIFIADEPELSLHIEWQAKVISSLKKLNPSSQVIVATHSPEICGEWGDKIIDMKDIIKNG